MNKRYVLAIAIGSISMIAVTLATWFFSNIGIGGIIFLMFAAYCGGLFVGMIIPFKPRRKSKCNIYTLTARNWYSRYGKSV